MGFSISQQRTKLNTEIHHSTKFLKKIVNRNESPLNENEIIEYITRLDPNIIGLIKLCFATLCR